MKVLIVAVLGAALAGCATSSEGLASASVDTTMTSPTKGPQQVATCVENSLNGGPKMGSDGDHYWVTRSNNFGATVTRWDFLPRAGGGTNVELRTSVPVNSGDDKVRACL